MSDHLPKANKTDQSESARDTIAVSEKILAILLTVTRNLEIEKAELESSRMRNQALLRSIGEGLVYINEKGNIEDINPIALEMFGYKKEELVGKFFPSAIEAHDENGQKINPSNRPATLALKHGKTTSTLLAYVRKNGSIFMAYVTVSPVLLSGKPIGVVEVFRDASEENKLEIAKKDFVSIASHQLRTPATGVKAYLSMLLDNYAGELKPGQIKFLKKAYESNERQLKIVSEMLNVARVESGRLIPEFETCDISALISDIADEQRSEINSRGQSLQLDLPARLDAEVDTSLFRMLIENILSNASKYTNNGGKINLAVSAEGSNLVIHIKDSGVGIPQTDLPKLYKRFSRIKNDLSERGGSGLGLYLAKNVIEVHNGQITVDSYPGEGTNFKIVLPLFNTIPSPKAKGARNVVQ